MGRITLTDLTKEELIYIIKKNADKLWLPRAIGEIERRRREIKEAEAERWLEIVVECTRQYEEVLKPYNGKSLREIPRDVIERATEIASTKEKAYKEYQKLTRSIDYD